MVCFLLELLLGFLDRRFLCVSPDWCPFPKFFSPRPGLHPPFFTLGRSERFFSPGLPKSSCPTLVLFLLKQVFWVCSFFFRHHPLERHYFEARRHSISSLPFFFGGDLPWNVWFWVFCVLGPIDSVAPAVGAHRGGIGTPPSFTYLAPGPFFFATSPRPLFCR